MKRYIKWVIPFAFLLISNVSPFKNFYKFFVEGVIVQPLGINTYLTKDLKLVYDGYLKDTLKNTCYVQYTRMFPHHSHTLYRTSSIELWKFWRWGEYMFDEKWRQPYLLASSNDFHEAARFTADAYHTKNGFCSMELDNVVYPDSIVTVPIPAPKVSAK